MILFKSCYILVTKFQFSTFFDKEFLKQTDPKGHLIPRKQFWDLSFDWEIWKAQTSYNQLQKCWDTPTKNRRLSHTFPLPFKNGKGQGTPQAQGPGNVASAQMTLKWGTVSRELLQLVCSLSIRRVSEKRRREKQTGETVKAKKLLGTPPDW